MTKQVVRISSRADRLFSLPDRLFGGDFALRDMRPASDNHLEITDALEW